MKQKILFQTVNKNVPFEAFRDMKNSLKNVSYPVPVIGPKNVGETIKVNTDSTGYTHTIFDELLTNKIVSDYHAIMTGLELLKFYKKNGLKIFDDNILILNEMEKSDE